MNDFARYEKQMLFAPIGLSGQKKLQKARVGILGSGAMGTNLANILARSGVGNILIVDQDRVELSNLQRQMLFTEKDIGHAKAIQAAKRLGKINSEINLEAFHETVKEDNFSDLFSRCDLILDASDNFPARFLINRFCLQMNIPWVFSGVTAASGQSLLIIPGKTACLGCFVPEETPADGFPTVHNAGIITSIVTIIASISAATTIKYLLDKTPDPFLKYYDAWEHEFKKVKIEPSPDCRFCRPEKLRRK